MAKEVSDQIVIFLVILAVLVSFMGTYLVYINTNNVPVGRTVIVNNQFQKTADNGKVGVYVIPIEKSGVKNNDLE